MQFAHIIDEFTGIQHNYLILPLEKEQFESTKKLFEKYIPAISCSAVLRNGHPYIIIDYGFGGHFKSTIPLDETFYSGENLGDKFDIGEVVTIILTDRPQDKVITLSKKGVSFEVPLEELIAFSLTYTEEMAEIYTFYKLVQQIKSKQPHKRKNY